METISVKDSNQIFIRLYVQNKLLFETEHNNIRCGIGSNEIRKTKDLLDIMEIDLESHEIQQINIPKSA